MTYKKPTTVRRKKPAARKTVQRKKPMRATRIYRIPSGVTFSEMNRGGDNSTTYHYGRGRKSIKLPYKVLVKQGKGGQLAYLI